jgi:hypothetical protein
MKQGGVCIYVYQDLSYSKIDMSNFSLDQHIEVSASLSSNYLQTIYIVIIYRAPSGNFSIFLKKLESILNLYFRNNIKIILCGNINVNYLSNNNKKSKMVLLLASFNAVSTVNFPTRLQNNSI